MTNLRFDSRLRRFGLFMGVSPLVLLFDVSSAYASVAHEPATPGSAASSTDAPADQSAQPVADGANAAAGPGSIEPAPSSSPQVEVEPETEGKSDSESTEQGARDLAENEESVQASEERHASSRDSGTTRSGRETGSRSGLPVDAQVVGKSTAKPKSRSHGKTFGVSVGSGASYSLVTAGDKFCGEFSSDPGDEDGRKSVCTGQGPVMMDIALSYGVNSRIDIVLGARVALQKRGYDYGVCDGDTCAEGKGLFLTKNAISLTPGVRLWGSDSDAIFKFGGGVDFIYSHEDFDGYRHRDLGPNEKPFDEENTTGERAVSDHALGFRGGPVLQVDPTHNLGFFLFPAGVPMFRPNSGWFEIGFEATLGVQARFP